MSVVTHDVPTCTGSLLGHVVLSSVLLSRLVASLRRLGFLRRALWIPRNPFCRDYNVPDSQIHAGTVHIPCAATPCVGAVVSLVTLRWRFRRGSSVIWNTTSPGSQHAHITVRSELTFCQWRLWTRSTETFFLWLVFAFAVQYTLNIPWLWSLGYFAFFHASVLVTSACKLQDLGDAFITPVALAAPQNHKATCDQGHTVLISALGCSALLSILGIKKCRQQQCDHLFSQRCGDKRRFLRFSTSHIGSINILTFMSIFVKDLAAVGEGSCTAPVGKRRSIPHSSNFHDH